MQACRKLPSRPPHFSRRYSLSTSALYLLKTTCLLGFIVLVRVPSSGERGPGSVTKLWMFSQAGLLDVTFLISALRMSFFSASLKVPVHEFHSDKQSKSCILLQQMRLSNRYQSCKPELPCEWALLEVMSKGQKASAPLLKLQGKLHILRLVRTAYQQYVQGSQSCRNVLKNVSHVRSRYCTPLSQAADAVALTV